MKRPFFWILLGLVLGASLGATSYQDDLELAYRAFQAGDYATALQHYELALQTTTDPGLVAFNQGATLAATGRHTEAAMAFAQCLEDATGLRRIKAAFGQGTALTEIAVGMTGRRAVRVLQQALQSFEIAIREADAASVGEAMKWKMDAEHNRALAQALLSKKQQEPEPPAPAENESEPDLLDLLKNLRDSVAGQQPNRPTRSTPIVPDQSAGGVGTESAQTQPGRGNLPPLQDEAQLPPISAEEAARRLEQALQRLRKPLSHGPIKPGAKDW